MFGFVTIFSCLMSCTWFLDFGWVVIWMERCGKSSRCNLVASAFWVFLLPFLCSFHPTIIVVILLKLWMVATWTMQFIGLLFFFLMGSLLHFLCFAGVAHYWHFLFELGSKGLMCGAFSCNFWIMCSCLTLNWLDGGPFYSCWENCH